MILGSKFYIKKNYNKHSFSQVILYFFPLRYNTFIQLLKHGLCFGIQVHWLKTEKQTNKQKGCGSVLQSPEASHVIIVVHQQSATLCLLAGKLHEWYQWQQQ